METTKTSEAIAKRMRKCGWHIQRITWEATGTYSVRMYAHCGVRGKRTLYANAATPTAAYRDIERQWKDGESTRP